MKGYRFYLEFKSKTTRNKATVKNIERGLVEHAGTCIALYLEPDGRGYNPKWYRSAVGNYIADCACAVYDQPNSPVCTSQVVEEYLRKHCKRVPERIARQVHPELFKYLEGE